MDRKVHISRRVHLFSYTSQGEEHPYHLACWPDSHNVDTKHGTPDGHHQIWVKVGNEFVYTKGLEHGRMPCQNSIQTLDKAVYGKMFRVRKTLDTEMQRQLFIGSGHGRLSELRGGPGLVLGICSERLSSFCNLLSAVAVLVFTLGRVNLFPLDL